MRNHLSTFLFATIFIFYSANLFSQSCEGGTSYSWDDDISVIIAPCSGCHGGTSGLFLNSYAGISAGGNQCSTDNLLTGNTLINIITSTNTICSGGTINNSMNSNCGNCIDGGEISAIAAWIADGAPEVCAILPVSYTDISAEQLNNTININWGTATEINSDRYDIYHSVDLDRFDLIGTIDAAGNSNENRNYQFSHDDPELGYNYYKIIQTDFDGTENVSKMVSARYIGNQKDNFIRLYPNPATSTSESFLVFDAPMNKDLTIQVVDLVGKEVFTKVVSSSSSQRMFSLNTFNLETGSYVVMLYSDHKLLYTQSLIRTN